MKKSSLSFIKIKDQPEDYQLLNKWLNQPEVLQWYEGVPFDLKKTVKVFQPKIFGQTASHPFFILWNQQKIGYIQFYYLTEKEISKYGFSQDKESIVGIDLFIGDEINQNRGIGTKTVQQFCQFLEDHYKVKKMIVDPQVANLRAIKVYEKCGFKKQKRLKKHELYQNNYQDCWLMVKN